MASLDRVVAGVSCREVLVALSDLVDGSLPAEQVERLRRHVVGCQVCESFGVGFHRVIAALRQDPSAHPSRLDAALSARVRARLADEYRRSASEDLP